MRVLTRRVVPLFCWSYGIWILLTWESAAEQLLFGAGIAAAVAVGLAPLGEVARPWRLLTPRKLAGIAVLLVLAVRQIVAANLRLSRLIWDPRLRQRLRTGMIIVPTSQDTPGGLTAVGLVTSVIVDNQLADLDPSARQLQYHAVEVPEGGPEQAREHINGPVERILARYGWGQ